jgi:hypothetical protein
VDALVACVAELDYWGGCTGDEGFGGGCYSKDGESSAESHLIFLGEIENRIVGEQKLQRGLE